MRKITLLLSIVLCSTSWADTATRPTNLSLGGIADWAIVGGHIASGTGALPTAAATGAYYVDISTPSAPILYRSNGSSWVAVSSTGSTALTAHVAENTDAHGATETITVSLQVGSGTADTTVSRSASGTVKIASYTVITPETATPTDSLATGTLWYDSNTNKLRCYDGASWNDCW